MSTLQVSTLLCQISTALGYWIGTVIALIIDIGVMTFMIFKATLICIQTLPVVLHCRLSKRIRTRTCIFSFIAISFLGLQYIPSSNRFDGFYDRWMNGTYHWLLQTSVCMIVRSTDLSWLMLNVDREYKPQSASGTSRASCREYALSTRRCATYQRRISASHQRRSDA